MGCLINKEEAIEALGARPISWTDSDYELGRQNQYDEDMASIVSVPSIDIVRCKECKHNSLKRMSGNTYCDLGMGLFQLYDFCSSGERRNDG